MSKLAPVGLQERIDRPPAAATAVAAAMASSYAER
jgi:hypothetical protein